MKHTCVNCKYYEPRTPPDYLGECRYTAPVVVVVGDDYITAFPMCTEGLWCGLWTPKDVM